MRHKHPSEQHVEESGLGGHPKGRSVGLILWTDSGLFFFSRWGPPPGKQERWGTSGQAWTKKLAGEPTPPSPAQITPHPFPPCITGPVMTGSEEKKEIRQRDCPLGRSPRLIIS